MKILKQLSYSLILLDRDGTLNYDKNGYISDPSKCVLFKDVYEFFSKINKKIKIAVVTNQSGIGRGFYQEDNMHLFNKQINKLIYENTNHRGVDKFFYCPHIPEEECACRKPKPRLIIDALRFFHIEKEKVILVGDKPSDCEAGIAAGVESFIIDREQKIENYNFNRIKSLLDLL